MNRYWTLSGKPLGSWPEADTFVLRQGPTPEPGPGQALTRTLYISLDPYQWGYKKRGVEPPGAPCHARTVAQVVESRMGGFRPGDFVFNTNGWSEYCGATIRMRIRIASCGDAPQWRDGCLICFAPRLGQPLRERRARSVNRRRKVTPDRRPKLTPCSDGSARPGGAGRGCAAGASAVR